MGADKILACRVCGKPFTPNRRHRLYCSDDCADRFQRQRAAELRSLNREEGARRKKISEAERRQALNRVALTARELGITYGEYMSAVRTGYTILPGGRIATYDGKTVSVSAINKR